MIYIVHNAVAILIATLVGLVIGALVYRRRGRDGRGATSIVVVAFIAEFWLASILAGALILAPAKGGVWTMTLGSAFVIWIGFVLPVIAATYRARAMAWRLIGVDGAHWLAVMLAQAVVLRLVGLVMPVA